MWHARLFVSDTCTLCSSAVSLQGNPLCMLKFRGAGISVLYLNRFLDLDLQRADDTKVSPLRPVIPLERERQPQVSVSIGVWWGTNCLVPFWRCLSFPQADLMDFTDQAAGDIPTTPRLRVTRPSQTSSTDSESINAAVDEDFTRLAKARSNPNILRSTLEHSDITGEVLSWLVNSRHILTCTVSVTGFKLVQLVHLGSSFRDLGGSGFCIDFCRYCV